MTDFFHNVIKPLFSNISLMFDGIINKGRSVKYELQSLHDWQPITYRFKHNNQMIVNLEPWQLFRDYGKDDAAIDAIFEQVHYVNEGYEVDELTQSIFMQ